MAFDLYEKISKPGYGMQPKDCIPENINHVNHVTKGAIKNPAHMNRDSSESNWSVTGIQGFHANTISKSFEMRPYFICPLAYKHNINLGAHFEAHDIGDPMVPLSSSALNEFMFKPLPKLISVQVRRN